MRILPAERKMPIAQPMKKVIIPSTPFGPVAVLWSSLLGEPKILRVLISTPEVTATDRASLLFPDSEGSSCPEMDDMAGRMEGFLQGQDICFSLDCIRLDACSPFQQAVLRAEHAIPRGRVSTYQLIAAHLGRATGARAVGNALAHNPFPIIIPCHRAIRSDCSLGGYQGGPAMKRTLLEYEEIGFDRRGRAQVETPYYEKKRARPS